MKVNLQKAYLSESFLNESLKKNHVYLRVFERGNDYLVITNIGQQPFFLSFVSFLLSCFITLELGDIFRPLFNGIFKMFFTTVEAKQYDIVFMFVEALVIAFLIYILLKKLNFFLVELRFIGDKLEVINGNSKKEIRLSDIVKLSIESFKAHGSGSKVEIHRLNLRYFGCYAQEDIYLLNIENYEGAELILERINKYLEQNKKSKDENNNDRSY